MSQKSNLKGIGAVLPSQIAKIDFRGFTALAIEKISPRFHGFTQDFSTDLFSEIRNPIRFSRKIDTSTFAELSRIFF